MIRQMPCQDISEQNHADTGPRFDGNDLPFPQALLDSESAILKIHMLPLESQKFTQTKPCKCDRSKHKQDLEAAPTHSFHLEHRPNTSCGSWELSLTVSLFHAHRIALPSRMDRKRK